MMALLPQSVQNTFLATESTARPVGLRNPSWSVRLRAGDGERSGASVEGATGAGGRAARAWVSSAQVATTHGDFV